MESSENKECSQEREKHRKIRNEKASGGIFHECRGGKRGVFRGFSRFSENNFFLPPSKILKKPCFYEKKLRLVIY